MGGTNIFGEKALPVTFRQRLQWQYWNVLNGPVME